MLAWGIVYVLSAFYLKVIIVEILCVEPVLGTDGDLDVCFLPKDSGPCKAIQVKYYYDSVDGVCKHFLYGGCEGNRNRFNSTHLCLQSCEASQDICTLPPIAGHCDGEYLQYYYSAASHSCLPFNFSGCEGNYNRFQDKSSCELRCRKTVPTLVPSDRRPKVDQKVYKPEVSGLIGNDITLKCAITGNPNPKIKWSKDNIEIDGNQLRYRIKLDQSLRIITLHKSDSDIYLCTADNGIGDTVTNQIKLDVNESEPRPATILDEDDEPPIVSLNTSTTLNCDALGWPYPVVTWWKNNNLIPIKTANFEVRKDYSLFIRSVQLHDLGTYTCQAYNGIGTAATREITVKAEGPYNFTNPRKFSHNQYDYPVYPTEQPIPTTMSTSTITTSTLTTTTPEAAVDTASCFLPKERGTCGNYTVKWFFDIDYGSCSKFWYGGCDGNGNRFETKEECDRTCVEPIGPEICNLPKVAGPCEGYYPRWFYDKDFNHCAQFMYGGCLGNNNRFEKREECVELCVKDKNVAYAPKIDQKVYKPAVSGLIGDATILKCGVSGNPNPRIKWRKGNIMVDEIEGSQPRHMIKPDQSLQIVTLKENDSGIYLCTAENGIGDPITNEIKLEVLDSEPRPATILDQHDEPSVVVLLNTSTTLDCYALGWPCPTVTWWKGDRLIPSRTREFEIDKDNSLLIRSAKPRNLGEYTCRAYNGYGKAATWTVTIKAKGPYNFTNPADFKYKKYIINIPENPVSTNGTTTLRPSQPRVLLDQNTTGPPLRPTTTQIPTVDIVPVRVNITTVNQIYQVGSKIEMPCHVTGYPNPKVDWYKNNTQIYFSDRITISDTYTLTIINATNADSGFYQCEAENAYSIASSTLEILVKRVHIHPNCTDIQILNMNLDDCPLVVRSGFCHHKYYAKFCCRSCAEAGLLPVNMEHLNLS